ncbi:MAG: homogentisate 1,2-dioxygenase [Schleiferiaceae bacterium]|nr:homogentisate 1,2-dioxygenase [Schleiferiaceae bacterium]
MPFYQKQGQFPHKRHTQFRKENGELYHEELFGTIGFDGMSSLLYHNHPPTMVKEVGESIDIAPKIAVEKNMKAYRLKGFDVMPTEDYLESRVPVLTNKDCTITLAAPTTSMTDYFYKNAQNDEVVFVHEGSGTLKTQFGELPFSEGDYLVIPRGMIQQFHFDTTDNRFFIIESSHPVYSPKRYRNWFGQLLEHSPYCERDLRTPVLGAAHDELGDFTMKVKKEDMLHTYTYAAHPFGVVGWDGFNYPYAFSIHDFEPITGRVHQPPPVHQTFETGAFVICSFVPRLYDYHPESIPAPYNHSNIDSDEVLYYVDGDFMSRNNIGRGQITLHPAGIPHGPHPGTYEASIGKKETLELAVMVDTFAPLKITEQALALDAGDYHKSWIK